MSWVFASGLAKEEKKREKKKEARSKSRRSVSQKKRKRQKSSACARNEGLENVATHRTPTLPSLPRFSTRPRSDQNCRRDARGDDTSHAESEQAGRKFCAVREQRTDWRRQASRSVVVCVQYVTVSVRFRLGPRDCAVMLSFFNSACYVHPEG